MMILDDHIIDSYLVDEGLLYAEPFQTLEFRLYSQQTAGGLADSITTCIVYVYMLNMGLPAFCQSVRPSVSMNTSKLD